jgi:hypothetical protein
MRVCEVCGDPLDGRRPDAEVCGAACRRERSRLRRLHAGEPDGYYSTLGQYAERQRRRAKHLRED